MKRQMRAYWDERARINAAWYVDTTLDFDAPDMDRFFDSGEQIVAFALDGAPFLPRSEVALEIGAGLGRISRALADRYERVIGLDLSEEMLRRARSAVPEERVLFLVGDGVSLAPIRDSSVDLLLTFTVFQHIPDVSVIERYIVESGRVLRPGGLAVFQWNNQRWAWFWRLRRSLAPALDRLGLQRDLHGRCVPEFMGSRVPLRRIRRALDRAGLRARRTEGLGSLFAWVWAERA